MVRMIFVRTPLRLELLGGGTDMSYFYDRSPGVTLNVTLNQHVYIQINPSFDNQFLIRDKDTQKTSHIKDINNPRVRAALQFFKINKGLEILSSSDVPMGGTGLGSSSSFTVGLLQGLAKLQNKKFSPRQLAEMACHIEIDLLKEPIGKQDQYAAVASGANLTTYQKGGKVTVKPVNWTLKTKREFEKHLIFIYIGKEHSSKNILEEQKQNLDRKIPYLKQMAALAKEGLVVLQKGNFREFAHIMEKEWNIKKNLATISDAQIEHMYQKALKAGAWGGKVSGAGMGGFLTLLAPANKIPQIEKAFKNSVVIYPRVSEYGSQILSSS